MSAAPHKFKFRWLNKKGQPEGLRAKTGTCDGQIIDLDGMRIPIGVIDTIEVEEHNLIFIVEDGQGSHAMVAVAISGGKAQELKSLFDQYRSADWAESRRQRLADQGREAEFRAATCPECRATIDLSGLPATPQFYCRFCDSLLTDPAYGTGPKNESNFRICEGCRMYASPRQYSIGYFYFLVVVYGWTIRRVWCCPMCVKPQAWKMLAGNTPFILGIIPSIVQLTRAYSTDKLSGPFAGLHTANAKAIKGDFAGAISGYQAILQRNPNVAGIHYNLGMALGRRNELPRAAEAFELALRDCANYLPAMEMLAAVYERLGWKEKLNELQVAWEGPGTEPPPVPPRQSDVPGMPAPKQVPPQQQTPGSPFAPDYTPGQTPGDGHG